MTQLNLGADQAGQWVTDIRAAAAMLTVFHASNTDALAERLAEIAEAIEGQ